MRTAAAVEHRCFGRQRGGVDPDRRADPPTLVGHPHRHSGRFGVLPRVDHELVRGGGDRLCVRLARNTRLVAAIARAMEQARAVYEQTGSPARVYRDFRYRTLKSWSCSRRVVGKAQYLPKGPNPRFVVTSLPADEAVASHLYETLYCARGDMENRIKEQQLGLFAERTSSATLKANQLRLYFSSFAYVLMHGLGLPMILGQQCANLRVGALGYERRV